MARIMKLALLALLAMSVTHVDVGAQPQSEYALIRKPVFTNPLIWKLTKSVTNTYWNIDLFGYPKGCAQSYIMPPWYDLWSGVSFQPDRDWDRVVYIEALDNWIRTYSSHGTGTCQLWWPTSLDVIAPCNDSAYSYYYFVYVTDAWNNRIVRYQYDWDYQTTICNSPITGSGLSHPRDLDLNDNFEFLDHSNDYLWVISGRDRIKRFTAVDGQLRSTIGNSGCDGQVGDFCDLKAIVSGRSALLAPPYDMYANNDHFYVADAGNSRIVWFIKWHNDEPVSWMDHIGTSSSIVDLETDIFGQLWAVDKTAGVITKYTYDLFPLCTFGSSGAGPNQFWRPISLSNTGGYLGSGNMAVVEAWTDSTGLQYFGIGTDVLDFNVGSSQNEHWHYVAYILVDPSDVSVKVYNQQGGPVRSLFDGAQLSGACSFVWDGADNSGQQAPTGSYRVELIDSCMYWNVQSQTPVNVVTKEAWVDHVYNPYTDYIPGDVNDDESVDVADLTYLVAYLFGGGPSPQPYDCVGNVDASGVVDVGDLTYLVEYLYGGGPAPLDGCQVR